MFFFVILTTWLNIKKTHHIETRNKILTAAKEVFLQKGMAAARMQEIADQAGINKALLHYYFKNKNQLFDAVFDEALSVFIPRISSLINHEMSFFQKISILIENYIDILSKSPYLPAFILQEINRDPEAMAAKMKSKGLKPQVFFAQIWNEIEKGTIKPIDPKQLIVNILSMCAFPFAGRPLIEIVLFEGDRKAYDEFIVQRKTDVTKFVIDAIKA